jgi:ppGpp synthetase/RelA/SpoT-type nucleotidyltranferase
VEARNNLRPGREELQAEYNEVQALLLHFNDEVKDLLQNLLALGNVSLAFPLQNRVKTWNSVSEKLERVNLPIQGIVDLQDLVGFRVVLQFSRDVAAVCKLIETEFKVLNRYDTHTRLKEDQFGYSSVHFVIALPPSWLAVRAKPAMGDLRGEIQVRTTAQHIWAEASHTLQYKNEDAVPPSVRRAIYRVCALLETVDLECERVLAERDAYRARGVDIAGGAETLNVDLLAQVLAEVWPVASKGSPDDTPEAYGWLLEYLKSLRITTRDRLWNVLVSRHDAVLEVEREEIARVRKEQVEGRVPIQRYQQRLDRGVFYTHVGLTGVAIGMELGNRGAGRPFALFGSRRTIVQD